MSCCCSAEGTLWHTAALKLRMTFPAQYPVQAPKVRFITPVFHPNVYNSGEICLDILGPKYTPVFDIIGILNSIRSLLEDPNPNSPANTEAAQLYQENRSEYNRRVQRCVRNSLQDVELPPKPAPKPAPAPPPRAPQPPGIFGLIRRRSADRANGPSGGNTDNV